MTIARDRWQQHLKTRGEHYHAAARELEALDAERPTIGAGTAALALHALAEVFEAARVGRLTRNQHVLLRLGQLAAIGEGTGALVRRTARAAAAELSPKASKRFGPEALAAIARVNSRDAAQTVATEGMRVIAGANSGDRAQIEDVAARVGLAQIQVAQAGLLADMDAVADAVYER